MFLGSFEVVCLDVCSRYALSMICNHYMMGRQSVCQQTLSRSMNSQFSNVTTVSRIFVSPLSHRQQSRTITQSRRSWWCHPSVPCPHQKQVTMVLPLVHLPLVTRACYFHNDKVCNSLQTDAVPSVYKEASPR